MTRGGAPPGLSVLAGLLALALLPVVRGRLEAWPAGLDWRNVVVLAGPPTAALLSVVLAAVGRRTIAALIGAVLGLMALVAYAWLGLTLAAARS